METQTEQEKKLILKLKDYEYNLIKDNEYYKIKFDSKKEFNHIKRIIDKLFKDVNSFNKLCFEFDNNYIYLKLEVLKE